MAIRKVNQRRSAAVHSNAGNLVAIDSVYIVQTATTELDVVEAFSKDRGNPNHQDYCFLLGSNYFII